jgi:hypothetical protein
LQKLKQKKTCAADRAARRGKGASHRDKCCNRIEAADFFFYKTEKSRRETKKKKEREFKTTSREGRDALLKVPSAYETPHRSAFCFIIILITRKRDAPLWFDR